MEHGKPKSQERLESERFWADVERTAQEVAAWPEWKRGITERFLAAGFTAKDDNLPPRLVSEPAKTGPAKGKVNELAKMLPEYYEVRGWTSEGVPTAETLARLGL